MLTLIPNIAVQVQVLYTQEIHLCSCTYQMLELGEIATYEMEDAEHQTQVHLIELS